jgi:hypothetical protein
VANEPAEIAGRKHGPGRLRDHGSPRTLDDSAQWCARLSGGMA